MPGRNRWTVYKVLLALAVLLLGADRALAYVGPGADVTFISYAMTLAIWVLAVSWAVLLWPVYALLRWMRGRRNETATASPPEAAQEEARGPGHTDS